MRVNLEMLLDKEIFVVLRDVETLALEQEDNVFTLRGYEKRHGIWVETDKARHIPVKGVGSSPNDNTVVIFIPWHHIVTMVYFPGKTNLEVDLPKSRKIGFRQA